MQRTLKRRQGGAREHISFAEQARLVSNRRLAFSRGVLQEDIHRQATRRPAKNVHGTPIKWREILVGKASHRHEQ